MLLSAVSVLVVGQSSSEIPEGLTNNPVFILLKSCLCEVILKNVLEPDMPQMTLAHELCVLDT